MLLLNRCSNIIYPQILIPVSAWMGFMTGDNTNTPSNGLNGNDKVNGVDDTSVRCFFAALDNIVDNPRLNLSRFLIPLPFLLSTSRIVDVDNEEGNNPLGKESFRDIGVDDSWDSGHISDPLP